MSYCTYRMNTLAFWVLVLAAALGNSNADSLWDWEYCQTDNICSVGQGDCDRDAECEGTAVCGTNNCVDFDSSQHPSKEPYLYEFRKIFSFFDPLSPHSLLTFMIKCTQLVFCGPSSPPTNCGRHMCMFPKDCCRENVVYDWNWCTNNLCGVGEGDCDSDAQCEGDLVCGTDNCQDFDSSLPHAMDCCISNSYVPPPPPPPPGGYGGNSGGYGGYGRADGGK